MAGLADKDCSACRKGGPPLSPPEVEALLKEVPGWKLDAQGHLEREYRFDDFAGALAFANKVGALAEREDHHPDIRLGWGRAVIELWTHKVRGLTEADFVLAAKIDRLK